jgi:hypothetical protein
MTTTVDPGATTALRTRYEGDAFAVEIRRLLAVLRQRAAPVDPAPEPEQEGWR